MSGGAIVASTESVGRRREILYFALRGKKVLISSSILVFFAVIAVAGPLIRPGDPNAFVGPLAAPPDGQYWFGTTTFGQDVFAQFASGLRATFTAGLLGGSIAALIGMAVGFVAGYRGGVID
ncbi:MAG TPA: ABC transporter permease, partial [Coriobacteriia bacterium]